MAGASLDDMAKANETLMLNDTKGPSHWGVPDVAAASHNGVVGPVLRQDSKFLNNVQHITMDPMEPQRHYIASIAEDLLYERANNSVSVTVKDKVEFAGNTHTARAGANGSTMSLKDKQLLGYAPSDGRVKIGTVTGNYPAQADDVSDDELSGLITKGDSATLQWKKTVESSLELKDNSATINVKNNSKVSLTNAKAEISATTVEMKTTSDRAHTLTINDAGIHIDGLDMNQNRIRTEGPLTLEGGVIKIG